MAGGKVHPNGANADESVLGIAAAIRGGTMTAMEAVRRSLDRIEQLDHELNCFHEVFADRSVEAAAAVDHGRKTGRDAGPLAGVPIAVKDNLATDFGATTCGSRILENYHSPYTATAVQRLIDAGAIIIGKTNCDEFAMGSSTENCAFGPTRNPWDPSRIPGGSSGGSAAAVAARMVPAALGSDTGGSVRQPASHCGIVGFKPTYGRISRYGLAAYGSSLDQVGPFTTSVQDAALLLRVMAGVDEHDSTTADAPVPDYLARIDEPIADLRIGVPKQYLSAANDSAVNAAIRNAIEVFRGLGAKIIDVDLPLTDYGIATYYVIAPAEASSNLARYDGIRYGRRAKLRGDEDLFDLYARSRAEGFGPEVQRRIMLGTYVLSAGYYDAYYKRALQVRRLIKRDFDRAFERCHALIGPVSPIPAWTLGAKADPMSMYLCDVYTVNTNIAGIPGLSLPAGFATTGGRDLPIGLQIQCPVLEEASLLRIARMFEANTPFHLKTPPDLAVRV